MATRNQDAWKRALAAREIEIRGHMMIGPAFIDDFFHHEAVAFGGTDHLRVERCLLGKAADRIDELRFPLYLARVAFRRRIERCDQLLARIEVLLRLGLQELVEHLARLLIRRQNLQLVLSGNGTSNKKHDQTKRNGAHRVYSV